jgi:hypothetical protein
MSSFYDRMLAHPAGPPLPPEPRPPIGGTAPATPEAEARRAQRLALDKHRTPEPTPQQARRQLESREKGLLRELQVIERELLRVRQQLTS